MELGIAADHRGFELKERLIKELRQSGHAIRDFGAHELQVGDDYPDYVIPLARAVAQGDIARGIAICGSGVGASVAANKVPGVRAGLVHDVYSAHQGVEDDDMNVLCLGGGVVGYDVVWDLVNVFLEADFQGQERFRRRLAKVAALEKESDKT